VIRQRTICPFVKRKQEERCLLSGTLNTAVPCELQPPLASDIFTERHERAARKAGEAMSLRFLGRCVPAGWIVLSLIAAAFSAQPYRPMTW
jgi:hypothetical protein